VDGAASGSPAGAPLARDPFGGLLNWNDGGWAHGDFKPSI
jgi:hypothetical protein